MLSYIHTVFVLFTRDHSKTRRVEGSSRECSYSRPGYVLKAGGRMYTWLAGLYGKGRQENAAMVGRAMC